MNISPDTIVLWEYGFIKLNLTIVLTWVVMFVLVVGSWLITKNISGSTRITRWQNLLEVLVNGIRKQIRDVSRQEPGKYMPFVGTLFIFIITCNVLAVVPGFQPPTGSLSTTTALAVCVFIAVPIYGIAQVGIKNFLKQYIKPSPIMLPFNIIGDVSRTLALAVRLYGNMMSGTIIAGILLSITPFIFPVVMQAFGLLTGVIQAYIFAVLAMVYIASAAKARNKKKEKEGDI